MSARSSEHAVDLLVLVLLSDSGEYGLSRLGGEGKVAGSLYGSRGASELGGSGVSDLTLLWLAFTAGEDDEFVLVAVKSIHVQLELMFAGVIASVVNRDSNGGGEASAELGQREFLKSEALAVANLTSVLAGRCRDDGSELFDGPGEHLGGLSLPEGVTFLLASSLVKVSVDESPALPVLAEMLVRDLIVVLGHWQFIYSIINKTLRKSFFPVSHYIFLA